jgi:hypothetical protein
MLRDPVAGESARVGQAREVDRVAERISGARALRDRRLIEDAQSKI